jgi:hypothetical protein
MGSNPLWRDILSDSSMVYFLRNLHVYNLIFFKLYFDTIGYSYLLFYQ